jgi:hypothetical protein
LQFPFPFDAPLAGAARAPAPKDSVDVLLLLPAGCAAQWRRRSSFRCAPALLCAAAGFRSLTRHTRLRILTAGACRARTQVWSKPGAPPPPSQAAPPAEAAAPPAATAPAAPAASASHRRCFGDDAGGGRAMPLLKLLLAVLLASAVAISGSLSYSLGAWHRAPRVVAPPDPKLCIVSRARA